MRHANYLRTFDRNYFKQLSLLWMLKISKKKTSSCKCTPRLFEAEFDPVDKGHSAANNLDSPHPQPETQRPAQVSDED